MANDSTHHTHDMIWLIIQSVNTITLSLTV